MSAPTNKKRAARTSRVIDAPADPMLAAADDSPLPPSATSSASVRPSAAPVNPRGAVALLRLAAGVAVVLSASVLVAWGARKYVLSTPRFAIRTVLIDGESHRSAARIAELGEITVGSNIFALSLGAAESAIAADPWIERVTVRRKLPSTVQVNVVEREARGLAAIGGDLYLVARNGELFKRLDTEDPADLPLVTGMTEEGIVRDRAGVVQTLKRALDLADDFDRTGITKRYPLQEIHIEKDNTVVATIGRDAIAVHLGLGPYRAKLDQVARILVEVTRRKANVSVLFVDNDAHPERVVARTR
jgi:cell division protein FtsQ